MRTFRLWRSTSLALQRKAQIWRLATPLAACRLPRTTRRQDARRSPSLQADPLDAHRRCRAKAKSLADKGTGGTKLIPFLKKTRDEAFLPLHGNSGCSDSLTQ